MMHRRNTLWLTSAFACSVADVPSQPLGDGILNTQPIVREPVDNVNDDAQFTTTSVETVQTTVSSAVLIATIAKDESDSQTTVDDIAPTTTNVPVDDPSSAPTPVPTPVTCSDQSTRQNCGTLADCEWDFDNSLCVELGAIETDNAPPEDDVDQACSDISEQNDCSDDSECDWNKSGSECTSQDGQDSQDSQTCSQISDSQDCSDVSDCGWDNSDGECGESLECSEVSDSNDCDDQSGCAWESDDCIDSNEVSTPSYSEEDPFDCSGLNDYSQCVGTHGCKWENETCSVEQCTEMTFWDCVEYDSCMATGPYSCEEFTGDCKDIADYHGCRERRAGDCDWNDTTDQCEDA